ncbi:MAG: hypothetical protein ACK5JU_04960 [Bacteroidales bacterium]
MKIKLLLLLFIISTYSFAQEYTKFRVDAKQKRELLKNGDSHILMIELSLDENEKSLMNSKHPALKDPNGYIDAVKDRIAENPKLYKDICLDCYVSEYLDQKGRLLKKGIDEIESHEKLLKERKKQFELENKKRDSISNASSPKGEDIRSTPYGRLSLNLDGISNSYGRFTVFCNLDVEFANSRFSRFLQDDRLALTTDDSHRVSTETELSIKFIPRVSTKTEYIIVKYQLERTSKYKGFYNTSLDGKVKLIKKVEITGTPELILNLFLSYWNYRLNAEDNKIGELANYNVMGDRISLTRLSVKTSKITITPKRFNYSEAFGINAD